MSRWYVVTLVLSLVNLFVAESLEAADTPQKNRPRSSITILVDLSKSFAPLTADDQAALRTVGRAITSLPVSTFPRPITIAWLGIGTSSPHEHPPCGPGFLYDPKMIKRNEPGVVRDKSTLIKRLDECVGIITQRSKLPGDWTDISGAIQQASDLTQGIKTNLVIILSDFVESRPHGVLAPPFRLTGHRVVLLYRAESGDKDKPAELINRIRHWQEVLTNAGAQRPVCRRPINGLSESTLITCFE